MKVSSLCKGVRGIASLPARRCAVNTRSIVFIVFFICAQYALAVNAEAQSLEDVRASVRAELRREMGVDDRRLSPSSRDDKEAALTRSKILPPGGARIPGMVVVIAVTALITGGLMKLASTAGRKKKKLPGPSSAASDNEEKPADKPKDDAKDWGAADPGEDLSKPETAIDIYEKIERLQALKEKGILSEGEFSEKKKELLDRI